MIKKKQKKCLNNEHCRFIFKTSQKCSHFKHHPFIYLKMQQPYFTDDNKVTGLRTQRSIRRPQGHTSFFTSSIFSACLLKICLRTKSGPLNFLPLSGHSHLSLASSWVFAITNFSTSVISVKEDHCTRYRSTLLTSTV